MQIKECDVLILEDDEDLGQMAALMLKPLKVTILRYSNPQHFLQDLPGLQTRVLVMDMLLSGADGKDICRHLRTLPEAKNWKIILMSAHPDAGDACLQAGADQFISKPFDLFQFRNSVHVMLSQAITA